MSAGYSGTPLVRKLGIGDGARIALVDAPPQYDVLLGGMPTGVSRRTLRSRDLDFVHIFATRRAPLARSLARARTAIARDGMIWVSWPKKSSGVATEVGEADVRAIGLAAGLVDVKICAVDDVWSGLKFVIRLRDR